MSSTGEKASEGLFRLNESAQSSKGGDESMHQAQSTETIHKSEAPRLQEEGESAKGDPLRSPAHGTKPQPTSMEPLLGGHATSSTDAPEDETPRQVIAVSASKGPAAFFNLARKFLVTDEMCDLSALEGAIVSAVDAAHLLERSQLATIVRCVFVVYQGLKAASLFWLIDKFVHIFLSFFLSSFQSSNLLRHC